MRLFLLVIQLQKLDYSEVPYLDIGLLRQSLSALKVFAPKGSFGSQ